MMLIYSVIYLLLAIYVERINPGEFGIAQSWNYLFKKSYWKPQATATVQPVESYPKSPSRNSSAYSRNHWIESNPTSHVKSPSLTVSHLTKVNI